MVSLDLSCFRSEGGGGFDDRSISGAPAEVGLEAGEDVLNARLEDPQDEKKSHYFHLSRRQALKMIPP